MKQGANKLDQAQIKKGVAAGMSVEEVASILKIEPAVVQSFYEHFAPKQKVTKDVKKQTPTH